MAQTSPGGDRDGRAGRVDRYPQRRRGRPARGLFASRVTVCRLRGEHTIKTVESALGLETDPYGFGYSSGVIVIP